MVATDDHASSVRDNEAKECDDAAERDRDGSEHRHYQHGYSFEHLDVQPKIPGILISK